MFIDKIRDFFGGNERIPPSPEITKKLRAAYSSNRARGDRPYACYAPLKNMYFGHEGLVVACCYNRSHVIGTYPAQSIKEIWNSDQANELRAHLKAYNFSKGCEGCLNQLIAENFDATKAKQYDTQKMNANHFPSVMEFELDDTCNLECIMCNGDYSSLIRTKREGREPRKKYYDDNFIKQLAEFIPYLEEVKFYGGEPFLVPIYYQIWDTIIRVNPAVRISVQTNGTTVSSRVREIMQKSNFHINLSLDALNKELYESIRVNSKFETVMANLDYFYNYCKERKTFFGISACIMQQNWFEAPGFIRLCNKLQVPVYFHTVNEPDSTSLRQFTKQQLEEIWNTLYSELNSFPEKTAVERKNKKHYSDFLLQLLEWGRRSGEKPVIAPEIIRKEIDVETISDLSIYVADRIRERNDITDEEKNISIAKAAANFASLERVFPPNTSIRELIRGIDANDPDQIKMLLLSAESLSVNEAMEHLEKISEKKIPTN